MWKYIMLGSVLDRRKNDYEVPEERRRKTLKQAKEQLDLSTERLIQTAEDFMKRVAK